METSTTTPHRAAVVAVAASKRCSRSTPCCRGGSRGPCAAHPPRRRRTPWRPLRFHPVAVIASGDPLTPAGSAAAALAGSVTGRCRLRAGSAPSRVALPPWRDPPPPPGEILRRSRRGAARSGGIHLPALAPPPSTAPFAGPSLDSSVFPFSHVAVLTARGRKRYEDEGLG